MRPRSKRADDGNAFLPDPGSGPARTDDDLAESLAEDFVVAATSAEEAGADVRDALFSEEIGGPFLEVAASDQFDLAPDASNPVGAEKEPFPRAMRAPDR
ncbi:MAG: hypothetical protein ACREJ3_00960 [Polyangiaceae bacterium]